jgi:hypothetical protein
MPGLRKSKEYGLHNVIIEVDLMEAGSCIGLNLKSDPDSKE